MKPIIGLGAVLVLLGLIGLAIPAFTTSHTEDAANVGSVKVQTTEKNTHVIPTPLNVGVLVLGGVLIAVGAFKRD